MDYVIGDTPCKTCTRTTRFLLEYGEGEEENTFSLEGDRVNRPLSPQNISCDHCGEVNTVVPHVESEWLVGFYTEGGVPPTSARNRKQQELNGTLPYFEERFQTPFGAHPFLSGSSFTVQNKQWRVLRSFIVEYVEEDISVRTESDAKDYYLYEVENEGEQRWITVWEEKGENGILSLDQPKLMEKEKMALIEKKGSQRTLLFKSQPQEEQRIEAYQMRHGAELIIRNSKEETLARIFRSSYDELLNAYQQLVEEAKNV
ncbi:hypothetical protein IMZ31_19905 (plasmid) [Pontibacillus sp. ALD_SL1]|uniref:hypothetical protein n=1 Tax=Pontibacillus sp. ALD_SL1 TaxID=2777185 RepID=UPI001A96A58C|nr:hypothetical protein [Pontibacillus sp. ALD_SL1]QST02817.1 hypothetical protein IMZ31_19905 [Pontibacillus sp. ALD_SL1]